MKTLNAIDLCCGAGGWAVAARGLPIRFLAVADWGELPLETWRVNHVGDHPRCQLVQGDLSHLTTREQLGAAICGQRIDLVLGGIPCEQVSPVRRNNPTAASELAAWHELIDACFGIVQTLRPRFWCFEDVDQVARHLPPPLVTGSPYQVERIQAAHFGPQLRRRTFIGRFPVPPPRRIDVRTIGECLRPGPHRTVPHAEKFAELEKATEAANWGRGFVGADRVRILPPDKPSPTIMASINRGSRQRRSFMLLDPLGRRRLLSWQEMARVQGFPDDFLFACGQQAAEAMIGRAIPIYVGRAILEAIVSAARKRAPRQAAPAIA